MKLCKICKKKPVKSRGCCLSCYNVLRKKGVWKQEIDEKHKKKEEREKLLTIENELESTMDYIDLMEIKDAMINGWEKMIKKAKEALANAKEKRLAKKNKIVDDDD